MEVWFCPTHKDSYCLLKTGTKPGPNQGVSFYVCAKCQFSQQTKLPPIKCSIHNDKTMELQSFVNSKTQHGMRKYFRCYGRAEGQSWCGFKEIAEEDSSPQASQEKTTTNEKESQPRGDSSRIASKDQKEIATGDCSSGTSSHSNAAKTKIESHGQKKAVTRPLTFSDFGGGNNLSSPAPVDASFHNKSFHQYRNSPNPTITKAGRTVPGLGDADQDSSGSDSDVEVMSTKDLMKGLRIKDVSKTNTNNEAKQENSFNKSKHDLNTVIPKENSFNKSKQDLDTEIPKENLFNKSKHDLNTVIPKENSFNKSKQDLDTVIPKENSSNKSKHDLNTGVLKSGSDVKNVSSEEKCESGHADVVGERGEEPGKERSECSVKSSIVDQVDFVDKENTSGVDPQICLSRLREQRAQAVVELHNFQASIRAVKLECLPDKGQKVFAKVTSFKKQIASLDGQMSELQQQHDDQFDYVDKGNTSGVDAHIRLSSLREQRAQAVVELHKIQASIHGVKLEYLPDKGQNLLARVASFKQQIASLDRQLSQLQQQHGEK